MLFEFQGLQYFMKKRRGMKTNNIQTDFTKCIHQTIRSDLNNHAEMIIIKGTYYLIFSHSIKFYNVECSN